MRSIYGSGQRLMILNKIKYKVSKSIVSDMKNKILKTNTINDDLKIAFSQLMNSLSPDEIIEMYQFTKYNSYEELGVIINSALDDILY